jgi:hypothetical protein
MVVVHVDRGGAKACLTEAYNESMASKSTNPVDPSTLLGFAKWLADGNEETARVLLHYMTEQNTSKTVGEIRRVTENA